MSDRIGPKKITIICGSSLGLGFLAMSQVHAIWQVYTIYGVLFAIGVGGLFPAAISMVARWFTDKRGMMIGIVTAGLGIGTIILTAISHFITAYGWRWAYAILGIIVLFVILTVSQLLKHPRKSEAEAILKTPSAAPWLPGATSASNRPPGQAVLDAGRRLYLERLGQFSLMVHIVPYATGMKISPISAAALLSVIGGTSIFGRLIIGGVGRPDKGQTAADNALRPPCLYQYYGSSLPVATGRLSGSALSSAWDTVAHPPCSHSLRWKCSA